MICRSGSTMRSRIPAASYLGLASMTGSREVSTSVAAWMNSGSPGFFFFNCSSVWLT